LVIRSCRITAGHAFALAALGVASYAKAIRTARTTSYTFVSFLLSKRTSDCHRSDKWNLLLKQLYCCRGRLYREPKLSKTLVIAVVDDDESFRRAMTSFIRSLGCTVLQFASAEGVLEIQPPA
jgi:hypothetical protein